MSTEFDAAIARLLENLQSEEAKAARTRETINRLCEAKGAPPMFADAGGVSATSMAVAPDRFYGVPLATAVREVLQGRKAAGLGAADTDTIYEVLKRGGFQFDGEGDIAAKRGMAISLAKNTSAFHRVPSGAWGLVEWYDAEIVAKAKKRRTIPPPIMVPSGDQRPEPPDPIEPDEGAK